MIGYSRNERMRRSGAVLLAVLVCLGIASAITGLAMQRSLRARRQLNHDWQLEQTRLLLDAGVRHVHRSVTENPDYTGELLELGAALESYATARVEIEAAEDDAAAVSSKRFMVVATIQNQDVHPFQTKRSRVIATQPVAGNAEEPGAASTATDTDADASD
ncbi:hypothetical protein [Allorhodopirellula solitaria]|uniref:Uncharacterized protein n=1 Tax=Allorhodopirellula solitaria TaxID=2527987 RepID=A0A5C5YKN1_9BACT|nr:hypothetical protein [Allorhodopirellula solitaria]TWT75407.1 hypothetical protein CA85_06980 [Allorhodopirellula solitaria]